MALVPMIIILVSGVMLRDLLHVKHKVELTMLRVLARWANGVVFRMTLSYALPLSPNLSLKQKVNQRRKVRPERVRVACCVLLLWLVWLLA